METISARSSLHLPADEAVGESTEQSHRSTSNAVMQRWHMALYPTRSLPPIEHPGSMLRGILGHALRQQACRCPAPGHVKTCLYCSLFKPVAPAGLDKRFGDIPPPFVITPPAAYPGGRVPLRFQFAFWGPALAHTRLLQSCWEIAAATGLDPGRVPARCELEGSQHQLPPSPMGSTLGLNFISPLLVKKQGVARPARAIGAEDIFKALWRRLQLLESIYNLKLSHLPNEWQSLELDCQVHSNLKQARYQRYSNRQQQSMPLEGAVGTLWINAPLPPSVRQALAIGQWLHIGGKTALGMGAYQLIDPDSPRMNLTVEAAS